MPGDFSRSRSFPKKANRWRETKNCLNKPKNENDQLRGQKAMVHCRSLFPLSDRWAGQRQGKPDVRAHTVSPQSTHPSCGSGSPANAEGQCATCPSLQPQSRLRIWSICEGLRG